jgi:Thermolysin metallopeptidase, alpha-helical domain
VDLSGLVGAVVAAVGGIIAGALAGTLATRRAARTAARLIYAELVRNTAAIRYWRMTGQWSSLGTADAAWQAHGEALARKRGADAFTAVFTGYSALEGLAFVTADTSGALEDRDTVVEAAVADVARALRTAGELAGIDPDVLGRQLARMAEPATPTPARGQAPRPAQRAVALARRRTAVRVVAVGTGDGLGMIPAYLLDGIIDRGSAAQRLAAEATRDAVAPGAAVPAPVPTRPGGRPGLPRQTGGRILPADRAPVPSRPSAPASTPGPRRIVRDARHGNDARGAMVARREGDPPAGDATVDEVYDALGATWTFLWEVFGRDSLDGAGMELEAVVHFGQRFANSFWDGERLTIGDGDGELFNGFGSLDITAHNLAHRFIPLDFEGQSGALAEAIGDVFGLLVKQYTLGQRADEADWLVGAELLGPAVKGVALRSLAAPGTAYDDEVLGQDRQPAHMDGYVEMEADNGGVHINAGIPAHAFWVTATTLGGFAWEVAGRIWWDALFDERLRKDATFADFARLTIDAAERRAGTGGDDAAAVKAGWSAVGVTPA